MLYLLIFAPQLVLVPLASKALTRGHYRLIEGERYSIVRMEAYLRALAALPRGRGAGFKVTPQGRARGPVAGRARAAPADRDRGFTLLAVGYQTSAQILDLPGRLTPGASTVTTLWALVNVALIAYTVAWARSVQHRRRSHRFPVAVHVGYSADEGELPSLAGRIEDLSRHGARLSVTDLRTPGERLRLVLLLDDGPVELLGTVAIGHARPPGATWVVGFDFDDLDATVIDAIVAWCFRHPFGPGDAVRSRCPERRRGGARTTAADTSRPRRAAAAESAASRRGPRDAAGASRSLSSELPWAPGLGT